MSVNANTTVIVTGLLAALFAIVTNQASSGSSLRNVKIKRDGIAPIALVVSAAQKLSDD